MAPCRITCNPSVACRRRQSDRPVVTEKKERRWAARRDDGGEHSFRCTECLGGGREGDLSQASCILVTITSAPITAQLQLIRAEGTVLNDSLSVTVGAARVKARSVFDPGAHVYCRFVKASKGKVRATLAVALLAGGDGTDTVVVAAQ
jgi:hypothetical protein